MGLEEIEKLRAKLEKDPDSKVFLPLAEEYRKEGMLDEAIEVLQKGLSKYPQYTSARVALGKIYFEKGETEKAKEAFEEVIKTVPDNLFAQRKLAEIYFNEGNLERALMHYEKVLELNPLDEEVQSLVAALKTDKEEGPVQEVEPEVTLEEEASLQEEEALSEASFSEETSEAEPGETPEVDLSEVPQAEEDQTDWNLSGPEAEPSDEDFTGQTPVFSLNTRLDEEETDEKRDAFEEYSQFSSFVGEQVFEGPEHLGTTTEPEEDLFGEEVHQDEATGIEPPPHAEEPPRESTQELLAQADMAVREERFVNAMELYRKVLETEPENKTARQRLEELQLLLKVSGKGHEGLIEELERFKNAIKAASDEFSGSS